MSDQVMDLLQHRPRYRYVVSKSYYRKDPPVVCHPMMEKGCLMVEGYFLWCKGPSSCGGRLSLVEGGPSNGGGVPSVVDGGSSGDL